MTRPWDDLDRLVTAVEARATHPTSTIHGPSHWRAVGVVAGELADAQPAAAPDRGSATVDRELLLLFALLHDAMREDDGRDLEHGPRAAVLLDELRSAHLVHLSDTRADVLALALRDHTNGTLSAHPTVGICWDADRLLIGRVGIVPDPRFCSTPEGRRRAEVGDLPALAGPPSWTTVAQRIGVATTAASDRAPHP